MATTQRQLRGSATLIRSLTPADQAAVQSLILEILNSEYNMALSLDELPDLVDVHRTYRAASDAHFWVADYRGQILGCIGLMPLGHGDYELRRMYVSADARGMGLAQRLLAVSLQWCRDHGVRDLFLETNSAWQVAQAIYVKHGFTAIGREQLPETFPVVRIATNFYRLRLNGDVAPPLKSSHA